MTPLADRYIHLDDMIEINPLSAASFFIEMMLDDLVLACGTAFYFYKNENKYLVSNWHNLSGRNPITKDVLHSKLAIPNKVRVHGHNSNNLSIAEISTFQLYDTDGVAVWYEHPEKGSLIDVAVLPLTQLSDINTYDIESAINEIDPYKNWSLSAGEQLFVLGFPFGISDSCQLPIWKSASLASEPDINQENLPLLYVDTATRQGMSGSPVIKLITRAVTLSGNKGISQFHASFIGVYSGRITPEDFLEAQLGLVWKASCINDIINGTSRATT